MSTHSFSPVIRKLDSLGQEGSKVAWSGCSRSLVLEKGPPEFADFRLFLWMFQIWRNVKKALCGAKTPWRWGQHLRQWNQCQSERCTQTSAESLEVALPLSFVFLYKMIRVKKCETTGFEPGKSRPGFYMWQCIAGHGKRLTNFRAATGMRWQITAITKLCRVCPIVAFWWKEEKFPCLFHHCARQLPFPDRLPKTAAASMRRNTFGTSTCT